MAAPLVEWLGRFGPWLLELGLCLLLVFWVLGAYNRLMGLRNVLTVAWGQLDELLTRRDVALEQLVAAARPHLSDEVASVQAVVLAQERQRQATRAVRAQPGRAAVLQQWREAELAMTSPLARLHALIEQRPELAESEAVRPVLAQLAGLGTRIGHARQGFNEAAGVLAQALTEWPTRLLTGLFRIPRPTQI